MAKAEDCESPTQGLAPVEFKEIKPFDIASVQPKAWARVFGDFVTVNDVVAEALVYPEQLAVKRTV